MDWLFDDDDRIFEDDAALYRGFVAKRSRALEIDNDYDDPYGLSSEKE